MALLRRFFQVFIVLGTYNFGSHSSSSSALTQFGHRMWHHHLNELLTVINLSRLNWFCFLWDFTLNFPSWNKVFNKGSIPILCRSTLSLKLSRYNINNFPTDFLVLILIFCLSYRHRKHFFRKNCIKGGNIPFFKTETEKQRNKAPRYMLSFIS